MLNFRLQDPLLVTFLVFLIILTGCKSDTSVTSDASKQREPKIAAVGTQIVEGEGSDLFFFTIEGPEKIVGKIDGGESFTTSIKMKFGGPPNAALNLVFLGIGDKTGCALPTPPGNYLKLNDQGNAEIETELLYAEAGNCSLPYEMWGSTTFQEPIADTFLLEGEIEKVRIAFELPFTERG